MPQIALYMDPHVYGLQGQLYPALASMDRSQEIDMPDQLQTLRDTIDSASESAAPVPLADMCSLLSQMCHPDMSQRIPASKLAGIPWLRSAAAKPLASCPVYLYL